MTLQLRTIANPISDSTRSFTWQHGRQLASMTKNGVTWTYTYNSDGLRTKRTNGTATYEYVYNGSQLSQTKYNGNPVDFTYDANGTPLTLTYQGVTYYYVTNIQGDVIGITDTAGNLLISFSYEAYGSGYYTSHDAEKAALLAQINPLGYRGYVLDVGTQLYYLQSRYYDPELGRFINSDDVDLLGANGDFASLNLFAYCGNNPVSRADSNGEAWHIAIGAAVGLVAGLAGQVITDITTSILTGKKHVSNWQTYVGAAVGGAIGGAVLAISGNVHASNFATGFFTTGTSQALEKVTNENDRSWGEVALNSARDGLVSAALGAFLPGVKGVTSGRNNMSAVYRSGLTKLRNETAKIMSTKVMGKGVASSVVGGLYLDAYYGFMQTA